MSAADLGLLPWQRPAWSRVTDSMAGGRLGHALLLAGPAGTGKRLFARRLAAALWCRQPLADRLPCGRCADCLQVLSEAHSGYHFLRVPEDKRDIPIEAVRDLTAKLQLTSPDGRAKVAIIEPADALNTSGVNALLKTIEEPSPGSHLLLVSERPMTLLPTLRSRCQTLHFAVPAAAESRAWLATRAQGGAGGLDDALAAARGAPLRALELIESGALDAQSQWRTTLTELAAGRGDPLAAAQAIGEPQTAAFVDWLHGWLVDCLSRGIAAVPAPGASTATAPATALAAADPNRREAFLAEVQEAPRRLAGNVRALLVLESLTIGWSALLACAPRA